MTKYENELLKEIRECKLKLSKKCTNNFPCYECIEDLGRLMGYKKRGEELMEILEKEKIKISKIGNFSWTYFASSEFSIIESELGLEIKDV